MLKIYLEARHPSLNLARFYLIWLTPDLWGDWILKVTYGRIGTQGCDKIYAFKTAEDAFPTIKSILLKRASAPRRLGSQYQLIERYQDPSLPPLDVHSLLQTSFPPIQERVSRPKKTVFLPLFDP